MPIREGIAEHVFVVSSADFMSIYAANNLFKGIKKFSNTGGGLLGGIIANSINTPLSKEILDDFTLKTKTSVVEYIPRSLTVTQSELKGKTTIEVATDSEQAKIYLRLAKKIISHTESTVPDPVEIQELHRWARKWGDAVFHSENQKNQ
jgi:nitrogenase iron protein NifH